MLASVLDYMNYACLRTSEQVCRSTSDHTTTAAHCWVLAADTDQYMPPASKPWQTSCSRCCCLLATAQRSSLHQTGNDLREDPTTRGSRAIYSDLRPLNTRPSYTWKAASWEHWHSTVTSLRLRRVCCGERDQRGRQTDGQCGHTDAYC